ncbi:hypothetical protein RMN57_20720 [Kitasatospora sp. CM 4170]|uniref:Uncharacterized protein n=1 Tax=Kitasatospora aburaviensis TaxID=67265 RepID=A0ABW1F4U6_9ACTN|nr:hypothetical protein [Kitasatospora sp. CM 4170]WNM46949.1 hypothetical protein RMN57_20720 [Kitasatospora sp. CM 4170]
MPPAERRGPRLLILPAADRCVGWTLRAANGRQLGSGVRTYRSEDELAEAVRELIIERAVLRCTVAQSDGRLWVWTAHLPVRSTRPGAGEAVPVARSARGYLRRDQCQAGVEAFLTGLQWIGQELRRGGGRRPW